MTRETKKSLEQIAKLDGRYSSGMMKFVHKGLGATVDLIREDAEETQHFHITGRQLCLGLANLALKNWGRFARVVLAFGGVKTTRDFGEIVYLLIRHNWMYAQAEDSIEDFNNIYDFESFFEKNFKFQKS